MILHETVYRLQGKGFLHQSLLRCGKNSCQNSNNRERRGRRQRDNFQGESREI